MRTQVAIIGAGPAGLMLAQLLTVMGIESVVIERRSRAYVEGRIRAGVLEHGTVRLLDELGLGERMRRDGLVHRGIALRFAGDSHRIDFAALTGKTITVYGQHEVVKDLIAARLAHGGALHFDCTDVTLHEIEEATPVVRFRDGDGRAQRLRCDAIAGCDGFHGICREAVAPRPAQIVEHVYPFAWLGILAQTAPPSEELIYVNHPDGFALFSQRAPNVARLYLQCAPDENLDRWPDDRIWSELRRRLEGNDPPPLADGPILQKGVTAMRGFVCEAMRRGRLFLAGDAAHIVPPTGAKGMNLAIADVWVLANALHALFRRGDERRLDAYAATCLQRVWSAQRFSSFMTRLLHRLDGDPYETRLQRAELDAVVGSEAAARSLAENYVGLPLPA